LKIAQPTAGLLPDSPSTSTKANRFRGIATVTALALFLCTSASAKLEGQQGSGCYGVCNSTIVGAAVGIVAAVAAVGVTIVVIHDHHILRGCVASGSNGLELQTSDEKTYLLEGNTADIKVGERVKLHGSRKKAKDHKDSFNVDKVSKDYGACSVKLALNATR
jgi:hypothetical protein